MTTDSRPIPPEEHEYLLGTRDDELERLGLQNRIWSESAAAIWERAGFAPGQTILDVGCGPGYTTVDLAQLVGAHGRVVGVDSSARFIAALDRRRRALGITQVEARVGDVQALDIEANSVDGAYARWVLCYLEDPEAVIAGVARALRPGGAFAVQDYHVYHGVELSPRSAPFRRVIEAVEESWRARGGDPDVGTRLAEMMIAHGLEVSDVRPLVRVARPGSALWQWPETFFRNFLPVLERLDLITGDASRAFLADWEAHSRDPAAFLTTPPMVEVIGVKR